VWTSRTDRDVDVDHVITAARSVRFAPQAPSFNPFIPGCGSLPLGTPGPLAPRGKATLLLGQCSGRGLGEAQPRVCEALAIVRFVGSAVRCGAATGDPGMPQAQKRPFAATMIRPLTAIGELTFGTPARKLVLL